MRSARKCRPYPALRREWTAVLRYPWSRSCTSTTPADDPQLPRTRLPRHKSGTSSGHWCRWAVSFDLAHALDLVVLFSIEAFDVAVHLGEADHLLLR
jgi:hypothetical protein